jgi:hypothetical protein
MDINSAAGLWRASIASLVYDPQRGVMVNEYFLDIYIIVSIRSHVPVSAGFSITHSKNSRTRDEGGLLPSLFGNCAYVGGVSKATQTIAYCSPELFFGTGRCRAMFCIPNRALKINVESTKSRH